MNSDNLIYLDNHSTTRVDPRVVESMLPMFETEFGNAGSVTHRFGEFAADALEAARSEVALFIGASPQEIVFTSGATESNNLAIFGLIESKRNLRRITGSPKVISLATEHHAILDPLKRLEKKGIDVRQLPVQVQSSDQVGRVDLDQLASEIDTSTILVSVMLANNEIGTIQPLAEISKICREFGCWLHTDATQAVGRLPIDVEQLGVDLLSLSGHKVYGPKGVGALYVRQNLRRVRLEPQIVGGGQENGWRSGTLNVPGIVGLGHALQITDVATESRRLVELTKLLWAQLQNEVEDVVLNGPQLPGKTITDRLPGNLNCQFPGIDGQTLMNQLPDIALSSGSACTAANPEPSHVLKAIGLTDDQIQSSLRFGIGRFNTDTEIRRVAKEIGGAVKKLRERRS